MTAATLPMSRSSRPRQCNADKTSPRPLALLVLRLSIENILTERESQQLQREKTNPMRDTTNQIKRDPTMTSLTLMMTELDSITVSSTDTRKTLNIGVTTNLTKKRKSWLL